MASRTNLHLREQDSRPFESNIIPQEFEAFVDQEIAPDIKFAKYKRAGQQELLRQMIHCLIQCGLTGKVVSDSRCTSDANVRPRVRMWDSIVAAGFATKCVGSEKSGKVTRYAATNLLLACREVWELRMLMDITLARNTELPTAPTHRGLVCLHTGKMDLWSGKLLPEDERKKPVSFLEYIREIAERGEDGRAHPLAIKNAMDFWRKREDRIERINRNNLEHSWLATFRHPDNTTSVFQPNVCVRQIHVGDFFRAARLYSFGELSGQNLPKAVRRNLLIDGEKVAELDFGGMATRMLYHRKRLNPQGDIYKPEAILPQFHSQDKTNDAQRSCVRGFIKRATNICWNVGSHQAAVAAIGKGLALHKASNWLWGVISHIDKLDGIHAFIERIVAAHPHLVEFFFSNVGVELMTTDGMIMLRIMETFAEAGKPALPIHDSLVCRVSDVDFAREAMVENYRRMLQGNPVVNRIY